MSLDYRQKLERAARIIKNSDNLCLIAAAGLDGDTLGCVLASHLAMQRMGKKSIVYCEEDVPPMFRFLPAVDQISNDCDLSDCQIAILFDIGEFSRVSFSKEVERALSEGKTVINMDHHPQRDNANTMNVINVKVAAVCEMVYELLTILRVDINEDIATCLLTGIFTDTGSFRHANTTADTLRISGELMKRGAKLPLIAQYSFGKKPISTLHLWGRALERLKVDPKSGLAHSVITKKDIEECGAGLEDVEGLASVLNTTKGSKFSMLLTEAEEGKIRGSLRSEEYKGVDVGKIAQQLGGGGHTLASGFEILGRLILDGGKWKLVRSSI